MDEIARYNIARWQKLADTGCMFTQANLELTPGSAIEFVDPNGILGNVAGKSVLCLASGGGQQSAAFSMLGARVTVVDLSQAQLDRDREAALYYGHDIAMVRGDMRDLSGLPSASFEIVFQPYSLNFVPHAPTVFAQVARVIRPGGIYYVVCINPFTFGMNEADWNGEGYSLKLPYVDGVLAEPADPAWMWQTNDHADTRALPPREYRHTFASTLNSLLELGFDLIRVSDNADIHPDISAEPGSWDHRNAVSPPWLAYWLRYKGQV